MLRNYAIAGAYVMAFNNILATHAKSCSNALLASTKHSIPGFWGCGSHAVFQFRLATSHMGHHIAHIFNCMCSVFQAGSVSAARVSSGPYPQISDGCPYYLFLYSGDLPFSHSLTGVGVSWVVWPSSQVIGIHIDDECLHMCSILSRDRAFWH